MYRKRRNSISIIGSFIILAMTVGVNAQNKPASSTENLPTFSEVSLKGNKVTDIQPVRGEDILWKRDVYRMVDLKKSQNGALYDPVGPNGNQVNLFAMMFDLVAKNKVTAYEYLDGKELFTEPYAVKFKDLLKRFDIPYKERRDAQKANVSLYDIEETDIPGDEVTLYYLKEIWFLDQRNSSVKVKTVALCPVLVREDETGETRRHPMFWIPFESLRPYLSQKPVAADSLNSATRLSAYDFFNQRRYQGDIYKISNLKNQTLWDYCKTPEEIKAEQDRLEKTLRNIESTLWEPSQKQIREEIEMTKRKGKK
ncbi:MAG: gliding motility protein GldN [Bacteroidales bacterium]|nr:gliding motility protein GldN [Bacteroidales bacterium]